MTKKVINQNDKFREELINTIEPNFVFNNKPINRLPTMMSNLMVIYQKIRLNYC